MVRPSNVTQVKTRIALNITRISAGSTGTISDIKGSPIPVIAELKVHELVDEIVKQIGTQLKAIV